MNLKRRIFEEVMFKKFFWLMNDNSFIFEILVYFEENKYSEIFFGDLLKF